MHILPLIIVVCMKFITYHIFHIYITFFRKYLTVNVLYPERCPLKKNYEAASLHQDNLWWNVSFIISVYLFVIKSRCFSFVLRIVINHSPHEQASHYQRHRNEKYQAHRQLPDSSWISWHHPAAVLGEVIWKEAYLARTVWKQRTQARISTTGKSCLVNIKRHLRVRARGLGRFWFEFCHLAGRVHVGVWFQV